MRWALIISTATMLETSAIIEQDTVVKEVKPVENQPLMIAKASTFLKNIRLIIKSHFSILPHVSATETGGAYTRIRRKRWGKGKGSYADWVYQGDDMLGQLLDILESTGLADNTLVMVSADNGAAGREYHHFATTKEVSTRVDIVNLFWPSGLVGSNPDLRVTKLFQ